MRQSIWAAQQKSSSVISRQILPFPMASIKVQWKSFIFFYARYGAQEDHNILNILKYYQNTLWILLTAYWTTLDGFRVGCVIASTAKIVYKNKNHCNCFNMLVRGPGGPLDILFCYFWPHNRTPRTKLLISCLSWSKFLNWSKKKPYFSTRFIEKSSYFILNHII